VSSYINRILPLITNVPLSNSSKFTPTQGTITINTRLLSHSPPRPSTASSKGRFKSTSQPLLTPEGYHTTASSSAGPLRWEEDTDKLIVRIEVIDNGAGISPADVKERRLFSPFGQAGVGRFQGGSGTGLGLSLVRRIVKLMGGRMGVESLVSPVSVHIYQILRSYISAWIRYYVLGRTAYV
jgi:osomolarity two-component system, sensor histidine kinase SLN1